MIFGSKQGKLRDGSLVTLRPMEKGDEEALYRFFQGLPHDLLLFLRHNVQNREVIHQWVEHLNYDRVLPLLALAGADIVGDATLHRVPHGWKRHIGRVRVVVAPSHQGRGLATLMLNELVGLGYELGLEKLWAEIPLDSVAAVRACRNAGFVCKAVMEGLVKDAENRNIDILIMICDIARYFDRGWVGAQR